MKRFLWRLFAGIAMWQPKPHFRDAFTKDGDSFSMIFYRKTGRVLFERNGFGQLWSDKFLDLSHIFLKWAIASEKSQKSQKSQKKV